MHPSDDLNNRRVRQLIDQFNAEEAYSAFAQLRKLARENVDLAELINALRKARWKWPISPPVNAVGLSDR